MTLFIGFISYPVGFERSFEVFFKLLLLCQIRLMVVQPLKMYWVCFRVLQVRKAANLLALAVLGISRWGIQQASFGPLVAQGRPQCLPQS
jgi:hypothetical protein